MSEANTNAIIVRKAKLKDLDAIRTLYNYEILNNTSVYHYETRTEKEMLNWFQQKQSLDEPIYVALLEEEAIGFITYGTFRPWKGFQFTVEYTLHIQKGQQGRGVGKLLLEHLLEYAKSKGIHRMIGGVDAQNTKALAFHESMGFERVGHLKEVGYKFDQWLDLVFYQRNV